MWEVKRKTECVGGIAYAHPWDKARLLFKMITREETGTLTVLGYAILIELGGSEILMELVGRYLPFHPFRRLSVIFEQVTWSSDERDFKKSSGNFLILFSGIEILAECPRRSWVVAASSGERRKTLLCST